MGALVKVFANVCGLLIVIFTLTQFGRNTPCKLFGVGIFILGE